MDLYLRDELSAAVHQTGAIVLIYSWFIYLSSWSIGWEAISFLVNALWDAADEGHLVETVHELELVSVNSFHCGLSRLGKCTIKKTWELQKLSMLCMSHVAVSKPIEWYHYFKVLSSFFPMDHWRQGIGTVRIIYCFLICGSTFLKVLPYQTGWSKNITRVIPGVCWTITQNAWSG